MKKIVTVVGARPQFIKMAPVSRELRKSMIEVVVNTGQHYDYQMSGVFFDELDIPKPDYDLGVGSANHGKQTGMMLERIEDLLVKEKPDGVLVYGDTNSTLAGALAASKLHIPIFHVEAGLRSYNKLMPEEINRVLTDHVSNLLFAPTETAVNNLYKEGITRGVALVGDVMLDAVLYYKNQVNQKFTLSQFGVASKEYILATIHRAENTDNPKIMSRIFNSFAGLDYTILLPLHPRTKGRLKEFGLEHLLETSNIKVIEPVSYLEMLFLEHHAAKIVTDSGGVQKEAYFLQVPCYTLRTETEWVETVETGWNQLIHPEHGELEEALSAPFQKPYISNLFGDGNASKHIAEQIDAFRV